MKTQILKKSETDIPEGWELIRIGDHFDFKNGLNKGKSFFGHGTPIVNYMDVYKNQGILSKDIKGKVNVTTEELIAYGVKKGDVFFTRTSETVDEIGISAVIIEDLQNTVFSGFILRARPKTNKLDLFFKKYCFRNRIIRKQIKETSSYTTRALTNGRYLSEISFAVPKNQEEQSSIAKVLSDIDEFIDSQDKLIVKKEKIKQGTMQSLLTGKKRLSDFKENGYKQTELGMIPNDWDIKRIIEFTDCTSGGTPNTQIPDYWEGEIRWMNSGELNDKEIFDVRGRITEKGLKESSTKIIPVDCVLIGLAGQGKTRGTAAINRVELCINQSISAIFPSKNHDSNYLYYTFDNRYEEIRGLSTGGEGRGGLNLSIIREIKIAFPPKPEQIAIAQILSDIDEEIKRLKQKRDKYQQLKNEVMQQLLIGKIRLK